MIRSEREDAPRGTGVCLAPLISRTSSLPLRLSLSGTKVMCVCAVWQTRFIEMTSRYQRFDYDLCFCFILRHASDIILLNKFRMYYIIIIIRLFNRNGMNE